MTKKNALGRGLGALIEGVEKEVLEKKVEANMQISVDSIDSNPFQPRTHFDESAIEELAASIKQLGIVQPLTLREAGNGRYQLISGERTLRAARLAASIISAMGQPEFISGNKTVFCGDNIFAVSAIK